MPLIVGVIVLLNIAQVALIVWHVSQNNHITSLKNMATIAAQKFKPKESEWEKASTIIGKTDNYKEVAPQVGAVTKVIQITMQNIPSNVSVISLDYVDNYVALSFKSDSVLAFSTLVSNYFEHTDVAEIELKSASLDVQDNIYKTDIGIRFR